MKSLCLQSDPGIHRRIAESHSLDELNTASELNRRTANEILDKYRSKPVHRESAQETAHYLNENEQEEVV